MKFVSPAIRFKEEEKTYNEDRIDVIGNVTKEYKAMIAGLIPKITEHIKR